MQYEILYLLDQNHESRAKEIEKFIEETISKHGGKVLDGRWEDKRKLAFPVDHVIKGIYVARRFELEPRDPWAEENSTATPVISAITQELNLSKDILRFTIVKAEGMLSLEKFIERKNEELKERKKFQQSRTTGKNDQPKTPKKPQPAKPVKAPEPEKTGTNEEISEKLDEILNI